MVSLERNTGDICISLILRFVTASMRLSPKEMTCFSNKLMPNLVQCYQRSLVPHPFSANTSIYGLYAVSITVFHPQTPILGLVVNFVVQLDMKRNYLYLQPYGTNV
jgi:hypothetical protein